MTVAIPLLYGVPPQHEYLRQALCVDSHTCSSALDIFSCDRTAMAISTRARGVCARLSAWSWPQVSNIFWRRDCGEDLPAMADVWLSLA